MQAKDKPVVGGSGAVVPSQEVIGGSVISGATQEVAAPLGLGEDLPERVWLIWDEIAGKAVYDTELCVDWIVAHLSPVSAMYHLGDTLAWVTDRTGLIPKEFGIDDALDVARHQGGASVNPRGLPAGLLVFGVYPHIARMIWVRSEQEAAQ